MCALNNNNDDGDEDGGGDDDGDGGGDDDGAYDECSYLRKHVLPACLPCWLANTRFLNLFSLEINLF